MSFCRGWCLRWELTIAYVRRPAKIALSSPAAAGHLVAAVLLYEGHAALGTLADDRLTHLVLAETQPSQIIMLELDNEIHIHLPHRPLGTVPLVHLFTSCSYVVLVPLSFTHSAVLVVAFEACKNLQLLLGDSRSVCCVVALLTPKAVLVL